MKRILCLWLPNWPLARSLRSRPELGRAAVLLHESGPRGGERVVRVSPAAARLGARPAMTLADAVARWGNRLCLIRSDPHADREELIALARGLDRFSPAIGLEETERPEAILLDITGLGRLFEGERRLAELVHDDVRRRGLRPRVAVADTLGAAWAIAHFAAGDEPFIVLAPPGGQAALLRPLPTAALRLSAATLALLDELGLATIGQVLALPPAGLTSRFGPELLARVQQALGTLREPVQPIGTSLEFVASWDLEQPTDRADAIEAILARLCAALAEQLLAEGRGAGELTCTIVCENAGSVVHTVGLFQPAADGRHFQELLQLRMQQAVWPGLASGIRLEATRVWPLSPRQRELFADHFHAHRREYAALVNRLAGRLGRGAVVRPILRANAQPELAWREQPILAESGGGGKGSTADIHAKGGAGDMGSPVSRHRSRAAHLVFRPLERPLFLFRSPVAIEVVAVAPDGPPSRLIYRGRTYVIAHAIGPERIETGWWRRGTRRDYYRVQTETGERFWLYRSLASGRWRLHGEFA